MRRHAGKIGLAGALLVFVGISAHAAFRAPPFFGVDEGSHLGYAHAIADGHLPRIDDLPDIPADATEWWAAQARLAGTINETVWVANHPPLHYVLTAPSIWVSNAADRADGGLLWMRLANVAAAALGVFFVYRLAVETTGGERRIGVAAAALVAFVPHGHEQFALAMNDGTAFAASTALAWLAVRCVRRRRATKGDLAALSVAAACAVGARTSTMIVALAVVGIVVVLAAAAAGDWSARLRHAARVLAVGLTPAVLVFGWFYVRNAVEYGDIAASGHLMDIQHRHSQDLWSVLTSWHIWPEVYEGLTAPILAQFLGPSAGQVSGAIADVVALVALVGLGIVAATGRTGDIGIGGSPVAVPRQALLVNVVVVMGAAAAIVAFVVSGGPPYSRYAFPALGALATLMMVGIDRVVPRAGPLVVVGLLAYRALHWVRTDFLGKARPSMPPALAHAAGPSSLQTASLAAAAVGSVMVAVSLAAGAWWTGGDSRIRCTHEQ